MQGKQTNSRSYFKDDLYFASVDQVYLYKTKEKWLSINDRCFVMPIKETELLVNYKEANNIGILKIGNSSLEELRITPGHVVTFKAGSGYKEDEEEYNPSWAQSG